LAHAAAGRSANATASAVDRQPGITIPMADRTTR
jgi:hypothetical protein